MAEKTKILFHSELAKLTASGPIEVEVKFPLKESLHRPGEWQVGLRLPGDKLARFYPAENAACRAAFDGVTGNIKLKATGNRESAAVEINGGGSSSSRPAPQSSTPPQRQAPPQDPIGDASRFLGRHGRLYQLALEEGERQRAEYNQRNPQAQMADSQFQGMVSFLAIAAKDAGHATHIPL